MALEQMKTTHVYGNHHYCNTHSQKVDVEHIDDCSLLKIGDHPVSSIVMPLQNVESIWDLERTKLVARPTSYLSLIASSQNWKKRCIRANSSKQSKTG
jgi:hypothetical protein